MSLAILLFAIGLALSALFSGSETGFYRISRVRLLIDALAGDANAKRLLWASNNPAAFVGTALVGNNVANYVVSLAFVMMAGIWFPGSTLAEMLLPIAFAPVLFIYGELLPKNLFFAAPYRLLRRCVPALGFAGLLFAPISALLWLISSLLQWLSNTPTQTIRMEIARRELGEVLAEGHAVGLLSPAQRLLAQATFTLGARPLREFMTPLARQTTVTKETKPGTVLVRARKHRQEVLPVEDPTKGRKIVGYVSAVDCLLNPEATELPIKPFTEFTPTSGYLGALLKLQATDEPIALIRGTGNKVLGFVLTQRLHEALLKEEPA